MHLSIRSKLTLPYVLLALLIALGGGLIVTRLMLDSLEDRFTNQLIENRKLASELMVREENQLLETLRLLSHTEGISSAIVGENQDEILQLVYPATFNSDEDVVIILDKDGTVLASILKTGEAGEYQFTQIDEKLETVPFVVKLVNQEVDEKGDKYSGVSEAGPNTYFFVSGPVKNENGDFVGAILVGKSLKGIVEIIREETLAHATIYDSTFKPIASTFIELPAAPDIKPETVLANQEVQSLMRNINISTISYGEILSAWETRNGEDAGILGTALPKTFLARTSSITRWNVILQVVLAILAALLLGITLSGLITRPILKLKNAASEISKGNLDVRVNTEGTDEVAVLAQAFNEMAAHLKRSEKNLIYAYDKTIEGWVKALELRDRETLGHTLRAANLTMDLAVFMNIDKNELENIRRGVLLHDIGKMGIPDSILLKPGPLDERERKIIETHPILARQMLQQIEFLHPCMDIPSYHHERWNGTGYPIGLAREEIPLAARLFAVVDVWDALISQRSYRGPWTKKEALLYIKDQSGKAFDPRVVDAFFRLIKERLYNKNEQKTLPNLYLTGETREK